MCLHMFSCLPHFCLMIFEFQEETPPSFTAINQVHAQPRLHNQVAQEPQAADGCF